MVSFSPTSAGSLSSALSVQYSNGVGTQTLTENVIGTGATIAVLTLSNPSFNYGSVTIGKYKDQSFTVTNTGGTAATNLAASALSAPFSFKGGTFPGTGGSCGSTLGSNNQTCQIVVTFSPVAATTSSSTLTVGYKNGVSNQNVSNTVTGTGVTPALLAFSDASPFSFGTVTIGNLSSHTFTLTNSGASTATSLGASRA